MWQNNSRMDLMEERLSSSPRFPSAAAEGKKANSAAVLRRLGSDTWLRSRDD